MYSYMNTIFLIHAIWFGHLVACYLRSFNWFCTSHHLRYPHLSQWTYCRRTLNNSNNGRCQKVFRLACSLKWLVKIINQIRAFSLEWIWWIFLDKAACDIFLEMFMVLVLHQLNPKVLVEES